MNELLADLTGFEPNPVMLSALLYVFLFFLVGGSFACVQALNDAIKSKQYGTIISMTLIELVVAMFEVLFLYRELVDAITPWMAQQGFNLGIGGTLALAFAGWLGVRGMTWFLFGRYGTPALIAVLARETISREGARWTWRRRGSPSSGRRRSRRSRPRWIGSRRKRARCSSCSPCRCSSSWPPGSTSAWWSCWAGRYFTLPFRSLEEVLAATPLSMERKPAARATVGPRRRREARALRWRRWPRWSSGALRPRTRRRRRSTLVIGLDVSGSFRKGGHFDDAIDFASLYIYAHMKGFNGLRQPTDVFVGTMGGQQAGEAKTFTRSRT